MNQADVSRLISQLRIKIQPRHRNLRSPAGPEGRLHRLRRIVTALIKYERIELNYSAADESRGYAERLIGDAIRYGERDKHTMEMADYWLEEKQLIHKLFKVLVPRYQNCPLSYTLFYKAPKLYPYVVYARSVIELRGNPFPPLVPDRTWNKNLIHNVLMDEARRSYRKEKDAEIAAKIESSEKEQQNKYISGNNAADGNKNLFKQQYETENHDEANSVEAEHNDKNKSAKQVAEDEQLLKSIELEPI